ncbi:MAG: hypothetical protein ABI231_09000 [Candidatus Tumulicola sp.]
MAQAIAKVSSAKAAESEMRRTPILGSWVKMRTVLTDDRRILSRERNRAEGNQASVTAAAREAAPEKSGLEKVAPLNGVYDA